MDRPIAGLPREVACRTATPALLTLGVYLAGGGDANGGASISQMYSTL